MSFSVFNRLVRGTCLAVVVLAAMAPEATPAQAPTEQPSKDQEPPSPLASLRSRLEQSQLDDEQKQTVLKAIEQSESQAQEAASQAAMAVQRAEALKTVAARAEESKQELNRLNNFQPQTFDETLPELEARLATMDSELTTAKQAAADAESAMAQSTKRRREIETQIPELEKKLADRKSQTVPLSSATGTTLLAEANHVESIEAEKLLEARITALRSEIALIEAESAAGLPQLIRDVRVRTAETIEQQLTATKARVETLRVKNADDLLKTAKTQLTQLHSSLVPIGQQNQVLAELNQQLAQKIESAEATLKQRTLLLEDWTGAFQQARTRVETVGLTDAVGTLLRMLRETLPNTKEFRLLNAQRQQTINDVQYELIELNDRRNEKLDLAIDRLFRLGRPPLPYDQRQDLAPEARKLFREQRTEYLDPAIRSQTAYFNALVSISTTEQQIVDLVTEATRYIDERILWIRSTKPLLQVKPDDKERWFLIGSNWKNVSTRLAAELRRSFVLWGVAVLLLVGLLRMRLVLRREIQAIGHQVVQSGFTKFRPTVSSLLLTALTAAPLPLVFAFLGWRLSEIAGDDQATVSLGRAAIVFAMGCFPVEFMRQVCRPAGLAESHFGMPERRAGTLRSNLRWLLYTTVPLLTMTSFLDTNLFGVGGDTYSRYFYLAAMASLCVFAARLFHPRSGVFKNFLRTHQNGWANRLAFLWYPGLIGIPIALAVLAAIGYYFTSQQLTLRVYQSLCLMLTIGVTTGMVLRWAMMHRRRLRIEQARARRLADDNQTVSDVPVTLPDESPEELSHQVHQTRQLLQTMMIGVALVGLWMIWRDVFPAFDMLENWPLWQSTQTITELVPTENGGSIARTHDVVDNVTIDELVFAILMFGVALVAIRNVPGLLDFAILRRLPLDHSTRYAITTLVSYVIVMIGLVIACSAIGLHWSQIQWMATALTFGLAFGLQEMFANFIAGIIILFEQPVRVGDVVEIDGVAGVVTRIRMRATTITNWDRKDYIVPNKEFITGKLLNWTRSDEIARITVPIGIAYGSDTDLARELLLKAANDNPDIMDEPPPSAIFEGFGDNSLSFTLRVYIAHYEKRFPVTHDLHTAIDQAFRAANIEISFPQRDLHLRSMPEPMRRMLEGNPAGSADEGSNPEAAKEAE